MVSRAQQARPDLAASVPDRDHDPLKAEVERSRVLSKIRRMTGLESATSPRIIDPSIVAFSAR